MQGRSWMAALTLTAATALALALPVSADEKAATYKVTMFIKIAGLQRGGQGCDVEIKPAHSGCRFRPIALHVKPDGERTVVLDDVQTTSADKECAFAITMTEPGQPVKTVYKGLNLRRSNSQSMMTLSCYLSCPSKIAIAQQEQNKKRR